MVLTDSQQQVLSNVVNSRIFLQGPAGCGKTTTAVRYLQRLLQQGISTSSILVLTPQRTLSLPYSSAMSETAHFHGHPVSMLTMGGLARRMTALYWPLVKDLVGFGEPNKPPSFLTLESAQYFMAFLVSPLLDQGYFSTLTMDRNRLYSQIIDNLNKSAIIGFPHTEIAERLKSAWVGDSSQLRVFDDVQSCVNLFRAFCLKNNLLDYSLQIEIFNHLIWPSQLCRGYLSKTYHHLIYDNCEEDPPFVHDIMREWLPGFDSALIIYDENAGFRRFLGADPNSALSLLPLCDKHLNSDKTFTSSKNLQELSIGLTLPLNKTTNLDIQSLREVMIVPEEELRFYPLMLDWVTAKIQALIAEGTPPSQIVILAPYISDMLRFSLMQRLNDAQVPVRSHRPSRALRDEPVVQCLLTLTALAFPQWELLPSPNILAYALMQAIQGFDLVRPQLLVEAAYKPKQSDQLLISFADVKAETRDRISYGLGNRFEQLKSWLENTNKADPLDLFISRLFGEVLSQPGFAFSNDFAAGQITANLIESIRKFRWALANTDLDPNADLGKEYMLMVSEGVISAQYLANWQETPEQAVLIAPAYTFLMQNQAVDYQFWLDVSSPGWYERLEQPLTHPYVLSRDWEKGRSWTAEDEYQLSQVNLLRLMQGLIARCRKGIYLGLSRFNENGSDEYGMMLKRIQILFQQALRKERHA